MASIKRAMRREIPLRSMLMLGDGSLNREMLDGLLMMINGQFFKELGPLIPGIPKNYCKQSDGIWDCSTKPVFGTVINQFRNDWVADR